MSTLLRPPLYLVLVVFFCSSTLRGVSADKEIDLLQPSAQAGNTWRAFLEDPSAKLEDVWCFGDDGVLVCKGSPNGYIYMDNPYDDFVLRLDWRWPPGKKPGRGGVLVRMTGEHRIWPKSLEAQINAGDAGDFWGLDGYQLDGPQDRLKALENAQFGKLTNLKKTGLVEKPAGEWNSYEIRVVGPTVTLTINGQPVNRATGCDVVRGPICLTAEGDEIHFRNVRLAPIQKATN